MKKHGYNLYKRMQADPRQDSGERRKQKKRKHSRSEEKKHRKEKDRGGSKEHKKKEKEKKKHKSKSRQDHHKQERREKDEKRVKEDKKERDERKEGKDERKERDDRKDREPRKQKQEHKERDERKGRQQRRQKDDRKEVKQKQRERERQKDRERKDKQRQRRSRSREKKPRFDDRDRDKRNKQRSREEKYERWRREQRFRFDSPPKSEDSDMSDDPQKMDKLNKMKAEKQMVTSKADRKLYLGNLPPNITSNQLMQMLNTALKKMEINCSDDGDSIVSAWISPDGVGHYAFVEFRTAHEATAGLALNGASLYGYQLKLGRPKQYIEYQKQLLNEFGSDGNIDTIIRKVYAMGGFLQQPKIEERLTYPPSKVIVLKHIVTVEQLAIDEEYNQIVEDVNEMAKRHGDVIKVIVPRPMEIDLEEVKKRVKGLGYVFIKYRTVEQARYARKEFIKCMFSDRSVACSFFPQKKFDEGDLDFLEKIIIDF